MLRALTIGVVTGLLMLVCYQNRVIERQQVLIQQMTNDPACVVGK